ncbi:RNA polymerase sigma factor [Cryptosporangium aurantiacum]|uniref:RNA polymerase sigma-70 factor, ECF subfamily n=1 Tax=Cryptosporangium aurantiacum TaxID=134849 RepID=A0A1M7RJH4_9ACTN|nr:sigma-70 family RNA polymerase sigma factor [Cryptosporangium aurantiacum]SHN46290.1 RNA polymerase sigma-70 factor, ECF subfamily [Cryptosporangium aurantiacum]
MPLAPEGNGILAAETDQLLYERVQAADEAAFAELYDRYAELVHVVAVSLLRDRAAAEEVTQDVFVSMWTNPGAYQPERGSVRTWLTMLARRRAIDAVRAAESRQRLTTAAYSAVPPGPTPPDEAVLTSDLVATVRTAVDTLPDAQRTAILLAYHDGLTAGEISARLGIPEGTAKWRLRAGLQRLARRVTDDGHPDADPVPG